MIKAIETRYKGYRFRSRLEARWAVFFDALGVQWQYEPEGFDLGELGLYLPDFFIIGNMHRGPYIEIKGQKPTDLEVEKLRYLCDAQCAYGAIVWGTPGDEKWISIHKDGFLDGDENCNSFGGYLPPLYGSGGECLEKLAVIAARAARFEHGERPA